MQRGVHVGDASNPKYDTSPDNRDSLLDRINYQNLNITDEIANLFKSYIYI